MKNQTIVIIGGGAAGFFGAIACAEAYPHHRVVILEKANQVLSKVRISGGGRCNVTHYCFDPSRLIQNYPRGYKALRGPFTRFQAKDTVEWFESRGIKLKVENDGRMFPISDSSETIIECLMSEARRLGVELRTMCGVNAIKKIEQCFELDLTTGEKFNCHKLMVTTGSSPKMYAILKEMGHSIVSPVPSLFTFNIPESPLVELSGVSVSKVRAAIRGTDLEQTGPLLITHWGFSGPAILKLSAWGARILHAMNYEAALTISWLPEFSQESLRHYLLEWKKKCPAKAIGSDVPEQIKLPRSLWKKLVQVHAELRWAQLSNKDLQLILERLLNDTYNISGKSTNKEEFVTSGGVCLNDIDFKTLESRVCPGLFFAGEVIDVDGVTGGFNFQNAWTTSWIAGHAIGETKANWV